MKDLFGYHAGDAHFSFTLDDRRTHTMRCKGAKTVAPDDYPMFST